MAGVATALGDSLRDKVQNAKILVVGAGGIGCELLKNLVLSGFEDIHVVDLDTIDVSNLNRQFLFRSKHVGQPKALVAKEAVERFNPKARVTAHHGNIKSPAFGMSYIEQFSLVFNALDNVDARKHVNRLCLATGKPLIESGTTGYLGQVTIIKKGETECYECTEKATQKVYPICTIRSTPDKMVHCIVWAKELFKLLFGQADESMLYESPDGEDKSVFMHLVNRPSDLSSDDIKALLSYAKGVLQGLFHLEIEKKLQMNEYKTAAKVPQALHLDSLINDNDLQDLQIQLAKEKNAEKVDRVWDDRKVWSKEESARRFLSTIVRTLHGKETREHVGSLQFDKDDALAMEFVAAAANLRAAVFSIQTESLYNCKGIAGNIIPAIATTNAVVGGLQVLEAFRILRDEKPVREKCHFTYCNRTWDSRGMLLNPTQLGTPNPKCLACNQQLLELRIDTTKTTLREVVDNVLKKKLGVNEPAISIGANTIYEEGEEAEAALQQHLGKNLMDLPAGGVRNDVVLTIEDFSQDFECRLRILQTPVESFGEEATELFQLGGELQATQADTTEEQADDQGEDDELLEVWDDSVESVGEKRLWKEPASVQSQKSARTTEG